MKKPPVLSAMIFVLIIITIGVAKVTPDNPLPNNKCDEQISDYINIVNEKGCVGFYGVDDVSKKSNLAYECRFKYIKFSESSLENEFKVAEDKCLKEMFDERERRERISKLDERERISEPLDLGSDNEIVCLTSDPRTCKTKDFWSRVNSGEIFYLPGQ